MNVNGWCVAVASSWLAVAASAQATGLLPEFEVASIKVNRSGLDGASVRITNGSLIATNAPLIKILGAAFGISEDKDAYLLAGPAWIREQRYDIAAKFAETSSLDQVHSMLQSLLKQRLGMIFHREVRDLPAYALVVAKTGLKASPATQLTASGFRRGAGHLESTAASLIALADKLSQQSDRAVVDKTELPGLYQLKLDWTPDQLSDFEQKEPSLSTALQDQIGLRLEPRKLPMYVIVIDSMRKAPGEN